MWSSQGDMCSGTLIPGPLSVPGIEYGMVKKTDSSYPHGDYNLIGKEHYPNHTNN